MTEKLQPEESLLLLLNLARWNAQDLEHARHLIDSNLDWKRVSELAELNCVIPLAWKKLGEAGRQDLLPTELLTRWQAVADEIRSRNLKRSKHSALLLAELHRRAISVIVLKGSLFAETLYDDLGYKKMNDLDILIRREDAEATTESLRATGFDSVGALFGRKEISNNSHHTPPYVSKDLSCVIGLHWGLTSPLAPWRPGIEGIWARKASVTLLEQQALRMSWEDNLLHLCIHLPFFKIGLRELADVSNVIRFAEPSIDWDRLGSLTDEWKAWDAIYRVLPLIEALTPGTLPPKATQLVDRCRLRASRLTVADTDRRAAEPSLILRSRSTQPAKIEKAYAIFMLTSNYGEKLKAWLGIWALLLWPKRKELEKITALKGPLARVVAPTRLWHAMSREHGGLPMAISLLINAALMARATGHRLLGRSGPSLKQHPAFPLLEVLE